MTKPLPPIQNDPAFLQAQALHQAFDDEAQSVRQDPMLSDLAVAQKIVALWKTANAEIAKAAQDLQRRRTARMDELEMAVPVGPGIAADVSPADRAVLMQAWRVSLTAAREATTDELRPMWVDAQKFDDELQRRAVLTTLGERGRMDLVRQWWADSNGVSDQLDELFEMRSGFGVWALKVTQAFAQIPKPSEAYDLPDLEAASAALTAARVR